MIVKFEQSDASILHEAFGENQLGLKLCEISHLLNGIEIENLQNLQCYREIVALKSVITKALELSAKIESVYRNNI